MATHAVFPFLAWGEQVKKKSTDLVPVEGARNELVSWAVSAATASVGKKDDSGCSGRQGQVAIQLGSVYRNLKRCSKDM